MAFRPRTDGREFAVVSGRWIDPYTGTEVTAASELDIDHKVPLANAARVARSERRRPLSVRQQLIEPQRLLAGTASANRSKGDKGPESWRPPLVEYWFADATDWIGVKTTWQFTATQMLEQC